MQVAQPQQPAQQEYTPEEYLKLEEAADYKSEYFDGLVIPMAGGSVNHNRLARNSVVALSLAFQHQDYEAFVGDVRLWIPQRRIYTYPDVMAVAGEPQHYNDRTDTITNPQVIIEVLSDSTQSYDYGGKFEAYRSIDSFQEYLLIDQTRIHVDQYSKTAKKRWSIREYDEEDEAIVLTSVPFQITLSELYKKVKFEAIEPAAGSQDLT